MERFPKSAAKVRKIFGICKSWSDFLEKNVRMSSGRNEQNRLNAAEFLGDLIEGDTFSAGDATFLRVVRPGREDE